MLQLQLSQIAGRYRVKRTTRETGCLLPEVRYKLDITAPRRNQDKTPLNMNDLARISLQPSAPLLFDSCKQDRQTGGIRLIEELANAAFPVGIIR